MDFERKFGKQVGGEARNTQAWGQGTPRTTPRLVPTAASGLAIRSFTCAASSPFDISSTSISSSSHLFTLSRGEGPLATSHLPFVIATHMELETLVSYRKQSTAPLSNRYTDDPRRLRPGGGPGTTRIVTLSDSAAAEESKGPSSPALYAGARR